MSDYRALLRAGKISDWNRWRTQNSIPMPDLSNENLAGVNLNKADLSGAILFRADLRRAQLNGADLTFANLVHADLTGAKLQRADLTAANLLRATLNGADFSDAKLKSAMLVEAEMVGTILSGAEVYGASAWSANLVNAKQDRLVVTRSGESPVTVDSLDVAQFISLLLDNKLGNILTETKEKAVLLLGRFGDHLPVLQRMASKLRDLGYAPIIFDFEMKTLSLTETILVLAGWSCFVVADITNPKSVQAELQATVPHFRTPFVPLIKSGLEQSYALFNDLYRYEWVLPLLSYASPELLLAGFEEKVVSPALKLREQMRLTRLAPPIRSL